MYNKAWCTCRVVVLLYWPTAFWRFSRVAVSILPSSLRPLNPKQNNKVCSALESGYSMMKTGVFLWIPSKMTKPNCPPTEVFRVRDAGIFDKLCLVPYCTYCKLWNMDHEPCIMFHESNLNWNWCILVRSRSFSTLFNLCRRSVVCIFFSLLPIGAIVRASVIVLCPRAKHISPP